MSKRKPFPPANRIVKNNEPTISHMNKVIKENKVLMQIDDKRLTPTMQRVRCGRTQLFREKNKDDRSFISSDNCDISLEHEKREMYAELIDGVWYWVSGCAECNGEERDWMTYIECEKHDRCSVCSTNRKDIKGGVWGNKKGWICALCNDQKRLEKRRNAFDKLNGEEPDCYHTDNIICPHCGTELSSEEMHEDQEIECHVCEGEIELEVEYYFIYTTRVKGKRITS